MDRMIPQNERRKEAVKKILKIIIPAMVVLAGVFLAVGLIQPGVKRKEIKIGVADRGTLETSVSGSGRVVPGFEQIINSPISSRIVEVYCKEGDSVAAGTPLLRLDLQSAETEMRTLADERQRKTYEMQQTQLNNRTAIADLEMQVKVKQMDVERLKAEAVNERRLDSIGSGTGERVRQAEFAYETGCLQLAQLRQQLESSRQTGEAAIEMKRLELEIFDKNMAEKRRTFDDASLRAPRAATLTYITDQIGRQVGEGEKVAVISDLSHFKISGEISDSYADRMAIGSKVIVRSGKTVLTGKVTRLTPQSRNGVMEFTVTLDDDDHPRLRSGLKTEVHVLCDIHDNVVRIPSGSYFKGPGPYDMFVVRNNELHRRKVTLGDSNYDYVEVVAGLEPGDSIVTTDLTEYRNKKTLKLK